MIERKRRAGHDQRVAALVAPQLLEELDHRPTARMLMRIGQHLAGITVSEPLRAVVNRELAMFERARLEPACLSPIIQPQVPCAARGSRSPFSRAPHKGTERMGLMATEPAPESDARPRPRPSSSSTRPKRCRPSRPAEASGLVPLKTEETTELDKRVAQFVDELAALEFEQPGVRQEGRPADRDGPQGNRRSGGRVQPLPRPAGQGDRQGHRHRRRPDRASPHGRSARPQGSDQDRASSSGIIPFGNRVDRYFDKYRSSQTHISARSSAASATARTSC